MSGAVPDASHASVPSSALPGSAAEHAVYFYEREIELRDRLTAYVGHALQSGGSALVIATPAHTAPLEQRLWGSGVDLARAILEDRYIRLDAETTLARFMVGGWPDRQLFRDFLARPVQRAGAQGRRIYAFGEMVGLLCERGEIGAALELEMLWNEALSDHPMPLLCAYSKHVLGKDFAATAGKICACHSEASGLEDEKAA